MRHLLYLHGFASSPQSSKARFLAGRLAPHGLTLHCPDLNEPDFSTLTITRMIGQVADHLRGLAPAPAVLIGSSLGAFVALHLAERIAAGEVSTQRIERLILLAPALDFGTRGMGKSPDDALDDWRERGWLETTHHAYGETRRVHYELYADASRYNSFATTTDVPVLILQGRDDQVVDPVMVERFAIARPSVQLVMLDDDHQLKESLERVWSETAAFLGLDRERSWVPRSSRS